MTKKQPRYYLEPLPLTPATHSSIALECLVRKPGDTFGVVQITHAGNIRLWRNGKQVGKYQSLNSVYSALDRILSAEA